MTNYQKSMCYTRRSASIQSPVSTSCPCRREHAAPEDCSGAAHDFMHNAPLAMAYVAWQSWQELYDTCTGLQRGTIFKELDKPFLGKGGSKR